MISALPTSGPEFPSKKWFKRLQINVKISTKERPNRSRDVGQLLTVQDFLAGELRADRTSCKLSSQQSGLTWRAAAQTWRLCFPRGAPPARQLLSLYTGRESQGPSKGKAKEGRDGASTAAVPGRYFPGPGTMLKALTPLDEKFGRRERRSHWAPPAELHCAEMVRVATLLPAGAGKYVASNELMDSSGYF